MYKIFKWIFFIFLSSLFGFEIFGSVSSSLEDKFSPIYSSIKTQNALVDTIVVLVFLGCLTGILKVLLSGLFKGEGSQKARIAVSFLLAILITGTLVRITPDKLGFLGYYGGIFTFFILSAVIFGGFIKYIVWAKKKSEEKNFNKLGFWASILFGILIIDLTLTGLMKKLFLTNLVGSCGENLSACENQVPGLVVWIVLNFGTFATYVIFFGIIFLIFAIPFWGFRNKKKQKDPFKLKNNKDGKKRNEIERNLKLAEEKLKEVGESFTGTTQILNQMGGKLKNK